jgi:short-subunit dehydrogenase
MAGLRDLRDRVAIVTGASSGIGAQLARDAAARGARVALLARRRDRLDALARELGGPDRARALVCDVAERAQVDAAIGDVVDAWGGCDLLVNAAGWARHRLFKDEPVDEIARMMATNFMGTVHTIKAVLPSMRSRGNGWIVNVSSVAGRLGQPDEAAYSASKFAVTGLSEGLAIELAPLGIHVLAVYPALVRTEMFTDDVLARMPETAKRTFLEPAAFTRAVWRALARGRHEVTVPGYVRIAYALRTLLPALHRRTIRRIRLGVLPDLTT